MATVRYKNIPESLSRMTKPTELPGRVSIGLEGSIGEFYYIPVKDLIPYRNQARQHFSQEEIDALANSIKEHGIRQPLTIISSETQRGIFEVISGERRLRAAKQIGLEKVPCILLKDKDIAEEVAIVENIHRQDLHPIELGRALKKLLDHGVFKNQKELSEKLSINRSVLSDNLSFASFDDELANYTKSHK